MLNGRSHGCRSLIMDEYSEFAPSVKAAGPLVPACDSAQMERTNPLPGSASFSFVRIYYRPRIDFETSDRFLFALLLFDLSDERTPMLYVRKNYRTTIDVCVGEENSRSENDFVDAMFTEWHNGFSECGSLARLLVEHIRRRLIETPVGLEMSEPRHETAFNLSEAIDNVIERYLGEATKFGA